jgi:hypothetical protein
MAAVCFLERRLELCEFKMDLYVHVVVAPEYGAKLRIEATFQALTVLVHMFATASMTCYCIAVYTMAPDITVDANEAELRRLKPLPP